VRQNILKNRDAAAVGCGDLFADAASDQIRLPIEITRELFPWQATYSSEYDVCERLRMTFFRGPKYDQIRSHCPSCRETESLKVEHAA
jgi:hypothetical protein